MDYEKKYKEALGWMQSVYPTMTGSVKEDAEHYFPELKEAEDEKIRKWIIGVLSTYEHDRDLRNAAIAWLEKQGEKPFDYENANIQQNDFTPKIEQSIEIPFGAKDSELQEASYYIPKGFYSVLDGNKVIIKRFKNPRPQNN